MTLVRDLLAQKGNAIWTISCQATIREALSLMADKKIGALVVTDVGYVVGMFSERDYARKAIAVPDFSIEVTVDHLMTRRVLYCIPDETVDECMMLMTQRNIRHLPVLEEGILVGMISIGDVVKTTLSEMENRIKDLEEYLWIHMI
jgi:CBS domain-containing protein